MASGNLESLNTSLPDTTHIIVNMNRVALRSAAEGEISRIAALGIASLRACTVNVCPCIVHVAHGSAERDIDSSSVHTIRRHMGGAGSVKGIIDLPRFIGDRCDAED